MASLCVTVLPCLISSQVTYHHGDTGNIPAGNKAIKASVIKTLMTRSYPFLDLDFFAAICLVSCAVTWQTDKSAPYGNHGNQQRF